MTRTLALLALLAAGCASTPGEAAALRVVSTTLPAARAEPLHDTAGFVLIATLEMPTPGYVLEAASVDSDEPGRIVARITGAPPEGVVAQVITPSEVVIPLGIMEPGGYVVSVELSRGGGPFEPHGEIRLEAR